MKRIFFSLMLIAAVGTLHQQANAAVALDPPEGIHVGFFYSSLRPHGEWLEARPGFVVWRPNNVAPHWRPYMLGRWAWTDHYGWYWVSDEPFGWITYHYGRWYCDDYYGWVWVPDDTWGPAWVEWCNNDNYVGWAPLPPYAVFDVRIGIRFTTEWHAPIHYWNFVPYARFGGVVRYRDYVPERNIGVIVRGGNFGRTYDVHGEMIINRGIDRTLIERRGGIHIDRFDVREVRTTQGERIGGERQIEVYRPNREELRRDNERIDIQRGDRTISIDVKHVERIQTIPNVRPIQATVQPRQRTVVRTAPVRQQERRQALIQRYEKQPRPSPAPKREERSDKDREARER
ncbi:MAG TPA: DUF6600 domain-containing protein [Bacteroidota bacterium]|nr:DUF6600 domain-containing protein [Bacteroidota bacterium]